MQLTIYHPGTSAVWADALFVSVLQRSEKPSAGQVRKAIAAAVRAYGGLGCVQRVAQEFGDHPEAAVNRMRFITRPASGWPGGEAHPRRQAEDPARARRDGGPAGRPSGPRCGPGQGAGPGPADRLVPGQPGSVGADAAAAVHNAVSAGQPAQTTRHDRGDRSP